MIPGGSVVVSTRAMGRILTSRGYPREQILRAITFPYGFWAAGGRPPVFPGRSLPLSWLLAIGFLAVCFRLPHVGHVLVWDEAWNLGALRSLAAGDALFIDRYWYHPPLYMWLGLLLSPTSPGLDQRMELLSLALNTGALLLFVRMVSAFFGRQIALFTGIAYALLPGPVFFDTWLKRDGLVTLSCLAAVWLFLRRREYWAGLFLGLGMLGKETAVFYWGAVFLLAVLRRPSRRNWRRSGLMFALAILVSGWWFVLSLGWDAGHLEMLKGGTEISLPFLQPWWYYLAKLHVDLGWVGLGLLVAGMISLWPRKLSLSDIRVNIRKTRYLPIYLLLPGYVAISLSRGKPAWVNIVLLPPLALLVGLGWSATSRFFLAALSRLFRAGSKRLPPLLSGGVLLVLLVVPMYGFDYEGYLERQDPKQAVKVKTSLEISTAINAEVKSGERLLILPMIYRTSPSYPDPIVYFNLKVAPDIVRAIDSEIDYPTFKNMIMLKKVHWVLMSPLDGSSQAELENGLVRDILPAVWRQRTFTGGRLWRVDSLWNTEGG